MLANLKTCSAFICLLFLVVVTNLQADEVEIVVYFDTDTLGYVYGKLYWVTPNKVRFFKDHTREERIVSRYCDFNNIGYRLWFDQPDASLLPMHVFRVAPPPATSLPLPDFPESQNCEAGSSAVE